MWSYQNSIVRMASTTIITEHKFAKKTYSTDHTDTPKKPNSNKDVATLEAKRRSLRLAEIRNATLPWRMPRKEEQEAPLLPLIGAAEDATERELAMTRFKSGHRDSTFRRFPCPNRAPNASKRRDGCGRGGGGDEEGAVEERTTPERKTRDDGSQLGVARGAVARSFLK